MYQFTSMSIQWLSIIPVLGASGRRNRIYSIDSLTLQFLIKSMTSVLRARLCNI